MAKPKKPIYGEIVWCQYFELNKARFVPSRITWVGSDDQLTWWNAGMVRMSVVDAQKLSRKLNESFERICQGK